MFKALKYSAIKLKSFVVLSSMLVGVLLTAQTVLALSFDDLKDFSGNGTFDSATYVLVSDNGSYTHSLTGLNSTSFILDDATLYLRQAGNRNSSAELWLATTDGGYLLGTLSKSTDTSGQNDFWFLDSFPLSADALAELSSTDPWSLTVKLDDQKSPSNTIKIDYSELTGDYHSLSTGDGGPTGDVPTTVPEPGTLLLLGAGLLGVGLARKGLKK